MTRRQDQLNSRLLEIISMVVQSEMSDPRLQMVNVTRVQVNRDASHAMIYFVSADDEYEDREVEQAMNGAKGYFRSVLAEMLDLRYTPDLTFRYDHAHEETQRVLGLFDEIAEEREKNPPHFQDEEVDG
ncbi:MAG: 30S ribosome-binding factor RbfA [Chloroflexota bacterium]|nr:30S ribosome-binding factor RbfA [Chloroflexota bacterium]